MTNQPTPKPERGDVAIFTAGLSVVIMSESNSIPLTLEGAERVSKKIDEATRKIRAEVARKQDVLRSYGWRWTVTWQSEENEGKGYWYHKDHYDNDQPVDFFSVATEKLFVLLGSPERNLEE